MTGGGCLPLEPEDDDVGSELGHGRPDPDPDDCDHAPDDSNPATAATSLGLGAGAAAGSDDTVSAAAFAPPVTKLARAASTRLCRSSTGWRVGECKAGACGLGRRLACAARACLQVGQGHQMTRGTRGSLQKGTRRGGSGRLLRPQKAAGLCLLSLSQAKQCYTLICA